MTTDEMLNDIFGDEYEKEEPKKVTKINMNNTFLSNSNPTFNVKSKIKYMSPEDGDELLGKVKSGLLKNKDFINSPAALLEFFDELPDDKKAMVRAYFYEQDEE